jgi:alkylation response protein AidB-like acyl-CoA dehydrogenase
LTGSRQLGPQPGTELLDDRIRQLDRYCHELAAEFRDAGLALDSDPDAIADFLHLPGVRLNRFAQIPSQYWPRLDFPPGILDAAATALGWSVLWEQLGYGDPGVTLAGPRPSLFGGVLSALADQRQLDYYFGRMVAAAGNTFFALTEPGKGSAAAEMETTLTPAADGDGWVLNGEKWYIGNGARAAMGVVMCRRGPGLFGIEAVVLDSGTPGFSAELQPTVGLRGARISRLRFDNVAIPRENVLGSRLSPTRRGLSGVLPVLSRARPSVAAIAVGCARAACDYVAQQRPWLGKADRMRLEDLLDRIAAVRRLIHRVSIGIDHGTMDVNRTAAVKVQASHIAEEATLLAADLLGPASLIEHPWLEKTYRDVRAFEFTEGTTNVHLLSIFRSLRNNAYP